MSRTALKERTAEAILDAAMDLLIAEPHAGMVQIAEDAGVGRATLYRHFPTREALVDALQQRTRAAFGGLLDELLIDHDLERFVADLLALREGWACIAPRETPDQHRVREMWAPFERYVAHEQAAGTIDTGLPPSWVLAALRGQLRAAVLELDAGRLRRADAPALVVRVFLRGVSV